MSDGLRPAFDAILFDLGGVLVEFTGAARVLEWAGHLGSIEKVWECWLTSPSVRSFESGRSSPETFAAALIAELRLPVSAEELLTEFSAWLKAPYPGARQLLASLQGRYRLGCLANSNVLHWRRLSTETDLLDGFDVCLASHQIGVLKPDREAFLRAVDALQAAPSRVLFLDDNALNVEGARAAGLVAHRTQGLAEARARLREAGVLGVDD